MPSSLRRPTPGRTLAVLSTASLTYALLQSVVSPALPTLQRELGASETSIAWVLTAYLLSAAVCTPILGRLGDIFGKRRVLLFSLGGIAAGTVLAAVATSLPVMIAARAIQGLGGGIFPLAFAVVRDQFPREKVPGSIGLLSALLGLGSGVGVVLSGVIVDNLNTHWLFWLPFVAAALACVGTWLWVEDSGERAPGTINWAGAALLSLGLAGLLLALTETGTWGWGSGRTIGLFAISVVVLVLWHRVEHRAASPLVDMSVMRVRGVWTTNLMAFTVGAAMFSFFVLVPQFVQAPAGAGYGFASSVTAAGLFLLPMSATMLVAGSFSGRIEKRLGSRVSAVVGISLLALAYVLFLAAHRSEVAVLLASGVSGVGLALAFAAMANLMVQAVPPTQTGIATGMNGVARAVGAAFGAQLGATFLTGSLSAGVPTYSGYVEAFIMALFACAIGLAAALAHPGVRARVPALASTPAATEAA